MSFPRYPAYKDSGVEWLSQVPAHWEVGPCRAVFTERSERNDPLVNEDYLSLMANVGVIPYADKGDVGNKKPDDLTKCKLVFAGDLVINSMNYGIGSYGLSTLTGVCSPVYIVLTPRLDRIEERYAFRILENKAFQGFAQSHGNGILEHRAAINWDILKGVGVPLPPVTEQKAILGFLDHETAKIDALVAEQERLIELLKEKRQAVISHAVTKGLDPSVQMKDSGVEWLGEVPAHWEVSQLRYVVREGTSITYGIVQAGPEVDDGVPYIRTSDMSGDALPLTGYPKTSPEIDASYARSKVRAGDLVISIRASVGKCLPVPPELDGANLTQGTAKIAPSSKALAEFMLPFIGSSSVQLHLDSKAKGATFKEITLETLRKTPFLVPPVSEQEEIGRWVDRESQQFQALIEAAEQAQALLRERRTALISAAVTGQIDVRGKDSLEVSA